MNLETQSFNHDVYWEETYGYSQALKVGDTIYISGQLAHDQDGNLIGEGDYALQIKTTFDQLDKILNHFGATRNQIVEDTVMMVGLREHFAATAEAHKAYFGDHRPTSTSLGVVELAIPGQLVEIAAVVRLDVKG